MIAQNGEHRTFQVRADPGNARQGRVERTECLPAIITCERANIIAQAVNELDHPLHGDVAHVHMHIADMQNGEPLKGRLQPRELDMVMPHLDALRIAKAAAIQTCQSQRVADNGVNRIPILNMKEIEPKAKRLRLMFALDLQPLLSMKRSETMVEL